MNSATPLGSLPRYSGGGLGRGFAQVAHLLRNPLPSPPPECRGREKCLPIAVVLWATFVVAMSLNATVSAQTRTKEAILAEISANSLPPIDVPAMADATYAKQITTRRDAARQKRAAL